MKYLFVLLISFCSNVVLSQDYLVYFRLICQAEKCMLDRDYTKSIEYYDKAFGEFDFIFPKDAYVASQIASFVGDFPSFEKFIVKGIENGLPVESIKGNPHLIAYFEILEKNKLDSICLDSLHKINYVRINKPYRDTIIQMAKEDQRLRDKNETFWNAVIFNHKLRPKLYRKWMEQAAWQSRHILELTKVHGFPSHKVIGTHSVEDFGKFGTSYKSEYATVILFHYDFAYQLFEDVLPQQLGLGNITPKQLALLRDFATQHYRFGKVDDKKYEKYQYFIRWNYESNNERESEKQAGWIKENLMFVNEERGKIGLIPFEYQEKMKESNLLYFRNIEKVKNEKLPYFDFNFWGWE